MSIAAMSQKRPQYDLREVEDFIASLNVSREAQHLMNEILWAYNVSPEFFRMLSSWTMFDVIARALKTVRPAAGDPQVANELWHGLRRMWPGMWPLSEVAMVAR